MGARNRLQLLALASVLIVGCSSSKSNFSKLVERDPCLDTGPAKSVEYDNCMTDREARKSEALRVLLDDTGVYSQQEQMATFDDNTYQESDFPDTPIPLIYSGANSISAAEKQALPFKIRVTWKFSSKGLRASPIDSARMNKMERLILPAVQDKGLAKWVCTVTGGQQREWIFYTQSDEGFIAKTRGVLAQTGPYPIELSARKEPALSPEVKSGENPPKNTRITPKNCME
ncbi:DUF695 domain-containing protein [Pseudomonas gingeri]|nr:DUF695 domain-containing protein [Pseudomonas gingeri]